MKTSVALCTFNGEKFLQEQLSSILLQSVSVNEIVVCDDGSTDQTFEILKNYQGKFPKLFRIYRNEKNLGYVLNFEKAMSLCSGEIIFLCDQDDVWDKDKVERTVQFFSEHQEVDLVAHNLKLLDASETDTTFWDLKNFASEKTNLSSEKLLEQILLNGNVFPGMSLAIRKSFLKNNLPLQKVDSIIIHDYELVIKALKANKFAILNNVLGFYRQHESQSIGYQEKEKIMHENRSTQFFLLSNDLSRVKRYSEIFGLNRQIAHNFQKEIQRKYSLFLNQFPFAKRIWIDFKNRYYYKIIRF